MRLLCSWYRRRKKKFRSETIRCSPSPSADATSGLLQGARSSTPEPGRRSSRRERLGRALVDHVRRRRRVGACALTHRPGASLPVAPRRKPAFSFFSNHDDLALTSPFHLRGFHSTRRVSSRRSSHTQPFGGAGSAPAFGAGSAPAFGAAPAAGAASVRANFFFFGVRRFRSGADTSRSALDIL